MTSDANPVNWFEIPASDLDRAKAFYESTLGIEMSLFEPGGFRMAWFPMVEGGGGSTGALIQAETYVPSYDGTMVYFSVNDIEAVLKRASESGGRVVTEKASIGEFGFVRHFEDTEGNRVGLHSTQ